MRAVLSSEISYLGAHVTAFGAQLVHLRLGDVGSLLSLVQLVLQFAELSQVSVGLLLLQEAVHEEQDSVSISDTVLCSIINKK